MGGTVAEWLSMQTIMRKVAGSIPGSGPDWKSPPVHTAVRIEYLLCSLKVLHWYGDNNKLCKASLRSKDDKALYKISIIIIICFQMIYSFKISSFCFQFHKMFLFYLKNLNNILPDWIAKVIFSTSPWIVSFKPLNMSSIIKWFAKTSKNVIIINIKLCSYIIK